MSRGAFLINSKIMMRYINSKILLLFTLTIATLSCKSVYDIDKGVSIELATNRKASISNLKYELFFDIPNKLNEKISGDVALQFDNYGKNDLIIDFTGSREDIYQVIVNGNVREFILENEHIIIAEKYINQGRNSVTIFFESPNTSLNRRDDYLYTLLVPDRARTLFPCFDQPNLKAEFSLRLAVPKDWEAVSNGKSSSIDTISEKHKKLIYFDKTAPISTYLFSFVAGKFNLSTFKKDDREITIYYRETDHKKIAQLPKIFEEVIYSLNFMEKYTEIKYPFQKYDLIILPGFQYGGMEHVGATLYNDNRMFLSEGATINQELSRSALIAHETAHMWFGDYVTMDWFDEVWNKEVFANYFAAKITSKMYPKINNTLNFSSYHITSYSEDRTAGATPLNQPLPNLNLAGLVYNKIIYNKAPIVMDMIVKKMGGKAFRAGIKEYLNTYAYSNSTWDNLINILGKHTNKDLLKWSDVWTKRKGMPIIESAVVNDTLFIVQSDPFSQGAIWGQTLSYLAVGDRFSSKISFELNKITHNIELPKGTKYIVPNEDAAGYGFFVLDSLNLKYSLENISNFGSELTRRSTLINLFENLLNSYISPEEFAQSLISYIPNEKNTILYTQAINNISHCFMNYELPKELIDSGLSVLWNQVDSSNNTSHSKIAFNALINIGNSNESLERKMRIFNMEESLKNVPLSLADMINLSYNLAIYYPQNAQSIIKTQLARINNPDKIKEYKFVSPAVSPIQKVRDSVFASLLSAENRVIEPWALKSLSLLNHPIRQAESRKYIKPALDIINEIQQTGDIFLPQNWIEALLNGHISIEAFNIVDKFIYNNESTLNPMLMDKLKQKSDHLYR